MCVEGNSFGSFDNERATHYLLEKQQQEHVSPQSVAERSVVQEERRMLVNSLLVGS